MNLLIGHLRSSLLLDLELDPLDCDSAVKSPDPAK
jgi:hypothetical protein